MRGRMARRVADLLRVCILSFVEVIIGEQLWVGTTVVAANVGHEQVEQIDDNSKATKTDGKQRNLL